MDKIRKGTKNSAEPEKMKCPKKEIKNREEDWKLKKKRIREFLSILE